MSPAPLPWPQGGAGGESAASTLFLIFSRRPVAGRVKTRLAKTVGAEQAAVFHMRMTLAAIECARETGGQAELWVDDDSPHAFFDFCRQRYGLSLRRQWGQDLGERLEHALGNALTRHRQAMALGSDMPALTTAALVRCARALAEGADAALVPALDGGYCALGLKRLDSRLFRGLAWGEGTVLEESRRRLRQLGWNWHEEASVADIDEESDLRRFQESGLSLPWLDGIQQWAEPGGGGDRGAVPATTHSQKGIK